jgi:hypothetical protein
MDWDLWCRFIQNKAIWRTVDDYFSAARIHPATKTSSGGFLRLFEHWRVARKHTGFWFPKLTWNLFLSWGLEDAPQPLSCLFKVAYGLKSLIRFGEIKPNFHSSQFGQGQAQITFPWYGRKAKFIVVELELRNPGNPPETINIEINGQSFSREITGKEAKQVIAIEQPFDENVFNVSISTEPSVEFRVIKIMPSNAD